MPETPRVAAERQGAVGRIVIDNVRHRNALSDALQRQLTDAVRALDADPEVRVLVLGGAGREAFASGADIREFQAMLDIPETAARYRAQGDAMLAAIAGCGKPVIAKVNGVCLGAGLAVAAACDLRYASDGARFGVPAARLGIGYPVEAVRRLVELAGGGTVTELFVRARTLSAAEAKACGLVNEVFPGETLDAEIDRIAEEIAGMAPLAIRAARLSIRALSVPASPGGAAMAEAERAVEDCFASADLREGWTAFVAKRRPVFTGR